MATQTAEKVEIANIAENDVPITGGVNDLLKKQVEKQKAKGQPYVEGGLISKEEPEPTIGERIGSKPEKKPSFTKKLIDENKESTAKVEQYEADLKKAQEAQAERDTQIEALKKQLEEATTNKESTDIQGRITALEEEKRTTVEEYEKKLQDAQNRLKFYDLLEDPDFQRTYVEPINRKYAEIQNILAESEEFQQSFMKAMSANAAALRTADPKQRRTLEDARDQMLYELEESLPEFKKRRFRSNIESQIELLTAQAEAIQNHEVTAKKFRETRTQAHREGQMKTYNIWKTAYDRSMEAAQKEASIPEDLQAIAKELKLDMDFTKDEEAAKAAFSSADYPPEEITRVLAQGTQAKAYKAHIAVLQKALQDRDDVISKLRGAEPAGGERKIEGENGNGKPKDLSGFLQGFAKGRRRG